MTTLEPRHAWLRDRIDHVLDLIHKARSMNNFDEYKDRLNDLADELKYVVNEWMKCYPVRKEGE